MKITVLTSLYRSVSYLEGYFECVQKLNKRADLEILLLHNDPTPEEVGIINQKLPDLSFVKYIPIPVRENLYATWNRGVDLAKGEYIAVWNVDDVRFSDSLDKQAAVLDENPDILLTYGDFFYMFRYLDISDKMVCNADYDLDKSSFYHSHQIGCFPMWRKSLHMKYGYFDEQFKLVADFDFQIRIARTGRIKKTSGVLGAYLENVPGKLSSNMWLQVSERNVIYWRYAVLSIVNWCTLFTIVRNYKIFSVRKQKGWFPLRNIFAGYLSFWWKRFPSLLVSIIYQPRYLGAFVKHNLLKQ